MEVIVQTAQTLATLVEVPDAAIYSVAKATHMLVGPVADSFSAALDNAFPDQMATMRNYTLENTFKTRRPLPLQDPGHALFCVFGYLLTLVVLFGVSKVLGKQKYKSIGLFHNAFLFLLSLYMWFGIVVTATAMLPRMWDNGCENKTDNDWRLAKLMWVFMASKIPEYGDTFLMVVKHNYHQITFLHLYHHTSIFLIWFWIGVAAPGGDAYWSAMLNSGIHVIMYGYYAGTMIFSEGPVRRFLNSIKFMITKGQMMQFFLNVVQSTYLMYFVEAPLYNGLLLKVLFVYMWTLLALFGNFLIRGQRKAKNDHAVARKEKKKK